MKKTHSTPGTKRSDSETIDGIVALLQFMTETTEVEAMGERFFAPFGVASFTPRRTRDRWRLSMVGEHRVLEIATTLDAAGRRRAIAEAIADECCGDVESPRVARKLADALEAA